MFITLGGLGTILAVCLVCFFLVAVAAPLFLPGSLVGSSAHTLPLAESGQTETAARAPHLGVDEYRNIGWVLSDAGHITSFRPDTGEGLTDTELFAQGLPSVVSVSPHDGRLAFGFADATVRVGKIRFETEFIPDADVPATYRDVGIGEGTRFQGGILERTPEDQFRLQRLVADVGQPAQLASDSAVVLLDLSVSTKGTIIAALTRDGKLHLAHVTERKNLLTGEVTSRLRQGVADIPLRDPPIPAYLMLSGLGDAVFLAWDDGTVVRFDTRDATRPVVVEQLDLIEEPSERLTALTFLVGKTSLVVGDSQGRVSVWFRIKPDVSSTGDGAVLARGHQLPAGPAAVAALAPSPRSRMVAAGYTDGSVRLFQVTSGEQLAEAAMPDPPVAPRSMAISPKDDSLLVLAGDRLATWEIRASHPETGMRALFRPVWYEGYQKPQHVWQSSSATDVFEPKYGLVPLVFGTIKAVLYSMLFGAPLALSAAIYTSEFLHPRVKARVKPTIEIMASLPSVVLGFLAALVFAPLVERCVPQCLAAFVTIPAAYLLGAYLWQLWPAGVAVYAARYRLAGMAMAFPAGLILASYSGPWLERCLFAGDIKRWLDGQIGTGLGAWVLILFPLCALVVAWSISAVVTRWLRRRAGHWSQPMFGLVDLGKFMLAGVATCALVYAVSWLLTTLGWDPRGTIMGTYVQRNALVVGFVMGFAIIPIIYTISDDALSAVPESLRAGSLGAGATTWQTATRIVVPTAMSGLFSALMIGLGRAVGETMIVLMAAGNTPVLDWNIFNGFRTLSANIAVELPEAVQNSTHYRLLFLAALVLFVMTFVVNTIAEAVRIRFRRKAFQL